MPCLGAFRSVATMISFEIPMVVALMIPTVLTGSMSLKSDHRSAEYWLVCCSFLVFAAAAFIIFLISAIAELGRSPFDLNEGESEIVSGFHIEYSGMKFGWFYAGELLHAFTVGGLMGILFFWRLGLARCLTQMPIPWARFMFMAKALFGYWIIMWIKYTVPRIRIDHMLAFNWKFLTPLSFVALMVVAICTLLAGYRVSIRQFMSWACSFPMLFWAGSRSKSCALFAPAARLRSQQAPQLARNRGATLNEERTYGCFASHFYPERGAHHCFGCDGRHHPRT